jgi:hypothetical protein
MKLRCKVYSRKFREERGEVAELNAPLFLTELAVVPRVGEIITLAGHFFSVSQVVHRPEACIHHVDVEVVPFKFQL